MRMNWDRSIMIALCLWAAMEADCSQNNPPALETNTGSASSAVKAYTQDEINALYAKADEIWSSLSICKEFGCAPKMPFRMDNGVGQRVSRLIEWIKEGDFCINAKTFGDYAKDQRDGVALINMLADRAERVDSNGFPPSPHGFACPPPPHGSSFHDSSFSTPSPCPQIEPDGQRSEDSLLSCSDSGIPFANHLLPTVLPPHPKLKAESDMATNHKELEEAKKELNDIETALCEMPEYHSNILKFIKEVAFARSRFYDFENNKNDLCELLRRCVDNEHDRAELLERFSGNAESKKAIEHYFSVYWQVSRLPHIADELDEKCRKYYRNYRIGAEKDLEELNKAYESANAEIQKWLNEGALREKYPVHRLVDLEVTSDKFADTFWGRDGEEVEAPNSRQKIHELRELSKKPIVFHDKPKPFRSSGLPPWRHPGRPSSPPPGF
ncbi:hypothetical protein FACS1894122_00900 [Alphaproteobacteria bacterium]|nr:hypothetical protein FACS1894122_00900 [Alphaproteobacteria bacterium]